MADSEMLSSVEQMQLLQNVLYALKAKKCIDVGTFSGYSSLSFANALPDDGRVWTLDVNRKFVDSIAIPAWELDGVTDKIAFKHGSALESLRQLSAEGHAGTIDLIYIDADKDNYPKYYELAHELVRPGGIIAIDNVFLFGNAYAEGIQHPFVPMMRELNQKILHDDRVKPCILPIGDGLSFLVKKF